MGKKPITQTNEFVPRSGDVRDACMKLRGMAYLLEQCGDHPCPPLDEGDCFYGVSLVIADIHDEIIKFVQAVERHELSQGKGRKSGNRDDSSDDEDS